MAAVLDREQRITDLVIHGWVPVRSKNLDTIRGLFLPTYRIGFSAYPIYAFTDTPESWKVLRINIDNFMSGDSVYVECPWDLLTDGYLDAIEERLRQT